MTENLIRQRKGDAERAHVYEKARDVAIKLGEIESKKHGAYHNFTHEKLSISYDDFAPNLTIKWDAVVVFNVHLGGIVAFRPDIENWMKILQIVYDTVVPILAEEGRLRQMSWRKELFEKWGITSEAMKEAKANG